MEISQLQSFIYIAQTGSITATAEKLFLTQPAVTQQLRSLERELGLPLFERTGRGMRLTPAGDALVPYAQQSLAILDEGRQVLLDMAGGLSGRLILGAGVTTSIFHLPQWLRL